MVLVPQWSGVPVAPIMAGNPEPFSGIGGMTVHFLHIFAESVFAAILLSFLLLLLLTVLRKQWSAVAALWLFIFLLDVDFGSTRQWVFWLEPLLTATLITLAAARFGLLALYSCFLFTALSRGSR